MKRRGGICRLVLPFPLAYKPGMMSFLPIIIRITGPAL
jgi:hypothetical protein